MSDKCEVGVSEDPDTCSGKISYNSIRSARTNLNQFVCALHRKDKSSRGLRVYRCSVCSAYHIGRQDIDLRDNYRLRSARRNTNREGTEDE
jgi:hypothetical protein